MLSMIRWLFTLLVMFTKNVQANSDIWDIDGKLQVSAWSSDRSLTNREGIFPATLTLRSKFKINDDLRLFADGKIGSDDYFGGSRYSVVREFYLDYRMQNADVRLGKQILPWGRTDSFNPTDSLTSRDYRWLTPEQENQRFGNTGIRYAHHIKDYTITSVWLPYMRSSRIPLDQLIYIQQPDNLDNFAIKVDRTGTGLDMSLSFYSGIDTMPSLEVNNIGATSLVNHPIQRFGGDIAWAFSSYTLRAELAYTQTNKSNEEFSGKKYDYLYTVVGLEKQFANELNVIVQAVWESAFDWRSPNTWSTPDQQELSLIQKIINQQPARNFGGFAYRIAKKLINDTLELELSGIALSANQGFLLQPRIRYQANDNLSLALGGDYYSGVINSILGRLRDNSTVFLEITYAFEIGSKL